jgi:hypothetical protein
MKRFSWLDIALWILTLVLAIPLTMKFIEAILRTLNDVESLP